MVNITSFLTASTTASDNEQVNGIGINGTNPVSNFDNAMRENWAILRRDLDNGMVLTSKSANYTAVANDNNAFIRFSAAATLSLTAAATLGADWHCWVMADGGAVIIDPNSSETINGATTITIPDGYSTLVICDGTNFRASEDYATVAAALASLTSSIATKQDNSGELYRGLINGLTLSNNVSDATNDIDIAAGSAGSDGTTPVLMTLASALTKRLDASWAVGSGNGGLDTGSIANGWYYVWLIRRSDTGVVDALFSLSSTSPTMPTNYDQKRLIGPILRTGGGIKSFSQRREYFIWNSPVGDLVTATPSLTAANVTLTVPPIDTVKARITALLINDPAADTGIWIREKSQADEALSQSSFDLFARDVSQISVAELERYVDSSGQIQYKSNDSSVTTFRIITKGFEFPR